ncbi:hypothetical protein QBC40DRAFT_283556 [Triangularia verruculosa]|uniref:Peptidase C14 caspase domain-containing protein n=1 Tax=Triangularia verruculosa TaxID=2587418 RepID=A0AAN6XEC6_9PEZI|nr:hypothetical protein QBC40DRAFT_283556 [Triangularia verruculosa]
MAESDSTVRTHHAILIGVGSHNEKSNETKVQGALADIKDIRAILEPHPQIKVTTFGIGPDNERIGREPTVQNIRNFLIEEVAPTGSEGHISDVYIHFSGHGSREPENKLRNDPLVLVLTDNNLGTSFLAKQVAKLNEQKINVTVVLDCCFSASSRRDDEESNVRFMEYESRYECDEEDTLDNEDALRVITEDGTRGVTLESLVNHPILHKYPDRYAIFTACDANEIAEEIELKGKGRRGVLSYFFARALADLSERGGRSTYESLHQHLRSLVRRAYPDQTPMLYGKLKESFFPELNSRDSLPIVTVHVDKGVITLEAGAAHGVCVGDEYEAAPFYAAENRAAMFVEQCSRFRVVEVRNLTSTLSSADQSGSCSVFSTDTATCTWKARPVSSLSEKKTAIRLGPCLSEDERLTLREEGKRYPYLQLLDPDEQRSSIGAFSVAIDTLPNGDSYAIFSSVTGIKVPRIPTFLRGDCDVLQRVARVLGHLAKFRFFEEMEHEGLDEAFEGTFEITTAHTQDHAGSYTVQSGQVWQVTCANYSDAAPLYIAIFNFDFWWEISPLSFARGDGELLVLHGQRPKHVGESSKVVRLRMRLDEEDGDEREDVIKLFITNKPTSFQAMTLPSLAETESGRGDESALSSTPSGSLSVMNRGEKWAVRTFRIRTRK